MGDCQVCDGFFETLKSREEFDSEGFHRFVVYLKCTICGCGRVDYHPFSPIPTFIELEGTS